MNIKIISQWLKLVKQYSNGYYLSESDKRELLRLNHLIMELSHKIHNDNMLGIY